MDFGLPDNSGTNHDLPPQENRFPGRGRGFLHRKSVIVGSGQFPLTHRDMETQIHHVEQEAYTSVLRAFKAQSDAITWDKESLITELRRELRVSDEEHRILLSRVNAEDIINRIREWRTASGLQPGMLSVSRPAQDPMPGPTVSVSCKKSKTSQLVASMSLAVPSIQPSTLPLKQGSSLGARGKVQKSVGSFGRPHVHGWGSSGAFDINGSSAAVNIDRLAGKKVRTRRPEDNNFHEPDITDYNPVEVCPEDVQWKGHGPGMIYGTGHSRPGHEFEKSMPHGAGMGQRLINGGSGKDCASSQNFTGRTSFEDIEILHTDTLIKEVEQVMGANHPDPSELEKVKKVLKDHEKSLIDAIARLEDASDGESGNN